jgi:hypothetical protein
MMELILRKFLLIVTIIALIASSGIYVIHTSSLSSETSMTPGGGLIYNTIVSTQEANAIANSTSNLMEKLGKTVNTTALSEEIVFDGMYVTGSGLFRSLYSYGDNYYWTVCFNTSNPNGSSINFLFPEIASNTSQPVENFLQISFPLYPETGHFNSASAYLYANFSIPTILNTPPSNDYNSSNTVTIQSAWAGYEFYNRLTSPETVNSSSAFFNAPKVTYPPSSQNTSTEKAISEWVGLSNREEGVYGLLQTGVSVAGNLNTEKYLLWWEDYESNSSSPMPEQPYNSTSYAAPGNILWASVYNSYPNFFQFYLYDYNTTIEYSEVYSHQEVTNYAQFIVEAPEVGSVRAQIPQYSPPTNFEGGSVQLGDVYAPYGITTLYNNSDYNVYDIGLLPHRTGTV